MATTSARLLYLPVVTLGSNLFELAFRNAVLISLCLQVEQDAAAHQRKAQSARRSTAQKAAATKVRNTQKAAAAKGSIRLPSSPHPPISLPSTSTRQETDLFSAGAGLY